MVFNYIYVTPPVGHPLLPNRQTKLGKHRLVLWQAIGPGTHPCHHCGIPVTWSPGRATRRGALVVDHLDGNPRNNDLANLVASCHPCNRARGLRKDRILPGEPVVISKTDGHRTRGVEVCCEGCQEVFVAPRRNVNPQRYCGRSCMIRHQFKTGQRTASQKNIIRDDELFVVAGGQRVRAVRQPCEQCGKDYTVAKCEAKRRRICGTACRGAWLRGKRSARRAKGQK